MGESSLETPQIKMTGDIGSGLLWVCSILSLLVAVAGCIAVKVKHRCYIVCYGCLLGSIWLGIFIIGCVFAFAATTAPVIGEALCSPMNATAPNNSYNQGGLDRDLQNTLNGRMCTPTCPCPGAAKAVYDAQSEAFMNYFFRTRQVGGNNNTAGFIKMAYSSSNTFDNFSACWEANILPNLPDPDAGQAMNGMIRTMKAMEKRTQCSGICNPGLFYYTLDVTTGPPQDSCLSIITGSISDRFAPVGLAGIVSGLVMFLVWLFQYFLWCKYDD